MKTQNIDNQTSNINPSSKNQPQQIPTQKSNSLLKNHSLYIPKLIIIIFIFGIFPIILRTFPIISYIFYIPYLNIVLYILLFIAYFFILKKNSSTFLSINSISISMSITIVTCISIFVNFIIANFFCAISIFFGCQILDFYTAEAVINLSVIHLIIFGAYIAFILSQIIRNKDKTKIFNVKAIIINLFLFCFAIILFNNFIQLEKTIIINRQKEEKQKQEKKSSDYRIKAKQTRDAILKKRSDEIDASFFTLKELELQQKNQKTYNYSQQFEIPNTGMSINYPGYFNASKRINFPDYQYFDDSRKKNGERGMIYFKFNNNLQSFSNQEDAVNFGLNSLKPIFKSQPNRKLNQKVDYYQLSNGLTIYFIEHGDHQNWMDSQYGDVLAIVALPQNTYYFWDGYTDYDGGLEIFKGLLTTLKSK